MTIEIVDLPIKNGGFFSVHLLLKTYGIHILNRKIFLSETKNNPLASQMVTGSCSP